MWLSLLFVPVSVKDDKVWGKGLYGVLSECASAVCGACGLADRTTTCSGVHQLSANALLFFLALFVYKVPVDGNARRNVAQVQSTLMKSMMMRSTLGTQKWEPTMAKFC